MRALRILAVFLPLLLVGSSEFVQARSGAGGGGFKVGGGGFGSASSGSASSSAAAVIRGGGLGSAPQVKLAPKSDTSVSFDRQGDRDTMLSRSRTTLENQEPRESPPSRQQPRDTGLSGPAQTRAPTTPNTPPVSTGGNSPFWRERDIVRRHYDDDDVSFPQVIILNGGSSRTERDTTASNTTTTVDHSDSPAPSRQTETTSSGHSHFWGVLGFLMLGGTAVYFVFFFKLHPTGFPRGITLWQALTLGHRHEEGGSTVASTYRNDEEEEKVRKISLPADFPNPLRFALLGNVTLDTTAEASELSDLAEKTFQVVNIAKVTRRQGGKSSDVVDYALHDPTPIKDNEDGTYVTVRVIPQGDGREPVCILFRPKDELELTDALMASLKEKTIKDNDSGIEYARQHDYPDCSVQEFSNKGVNRLKLRYLDYTAQVSGKTRFYLVELVLSGEEKGDVQTSEGWLFSRFKINRVGDHSVAEAA
jgi:hypothetical protein